MSASRNRLPTGVALRYVGVVARGIGAVVPGRRGAALTRVVIAIVGLLISSIRGPQWDNKSIPACPPPPAVPPLKPAAILLAAVADTKACAPAYATSPWLARRKAKRQYRTIPSQEGGVAKVPFPDGILCDASAGGLLSCGLPRQ